MAEKELFKCSHEGCDKMVSARKASERMKEEKLCEKHIKELICKEAQIWKSKTKK